MKTSPKEAAKEAASTDAPSPKAPPAPAAGCGADWRALLAYKGSEAIGDERNTLIALRRAPELAGLLRFDEFALELTFTKSPPWRDVSPGAVWTEEDDTQCLAWLQEVGLKVRGTATVANCAAVVARDHPYHPVREYLDSLKWDGELRLQIWLAEYLNARGDAVYLGAVGRKYLVSAAARILQPGCQADHVLTLEAPQGTGKTSAGRALAVHPEWFAGDLPEIHGKDARLQLLGRWIIEIAELKAMRSSDLEVQKSFITQTHDTFRPPYARRTAQFPRQCVFFGTTNLAEYLRDPTGNRRWWPVKCGQIDVGALVRDRDQLWAEAVHAFRTGEQWHLDAAETALAVEQQQERMHVSELELDVQQYMAAVIKDTVTVRDVLIYGLSLDPDKSTYTESARKLGPAVAEALDRCGWDRDTRRGKARRTTYVRRVDNRRQDK
jgi:putative DNA primase/helicase